MGPQKGSVHSALRMAVSVPAECRPRRGPRGPCKERSVDGLFFLMRELFLRAWPRFSTPGGLLEPPAALPSLVLCREVSSTNCHFM